MATRKLIGGITLGAAAVHSAIRFGALGPIDMNLVDTRREIFENAGETANYLSVEHHRNMFYDKVTFWRDGHDCLPGSMITYRPMIVTHTNLDGVSTVVLPSYGF